MRSSRLRSSLFAVTVLAFAATAARADLDMTGRWRALNPFFPQCLDVVQTGGTLDVHTCDGSYPIQWTGTIDPATGAFAWAYDSVTRIEATLAADGATFTGTLFFYHCSVVGCSELPFDYIGSRCGSGTLDPGEQCDVGMPDGTLASGTCCTQECTFAPTATTCDADDDPTTDDACDAGGTCLPVPPPTCDPCLAWNAVTERCEPKARRDCRGPLPGAASLAMTASSPALSWAWTGDSATSAADFGDPRDATSFEACVFADDGATLLMAAVVPSGGTCGVRPCWSTNGAQTRFRYRSPRADGIRSVQLSRGNDGATKIRVAGKGAGLGLPPAFGGALVPITAQLRRTDAPVCWQARFPVLRANSTSRLRARDGQ
jgi:hypothetical protein